jgi:hypothetical protein
MLSRFEKTVLYNKCLFFFLNQKIPRFFPKLAALSNRFISETKTPKKLLQDENSCHIRVCVKSQL